MCLFLNRWWRKSRLWQRKLRRKWIAWAGKERRTGTYLTPSRNISWPEREKWVKHREDECPSELKHNFIKSHFWSCFPFSVKESIKKSTWYLKLRNFWYVDLTALSCYWGLIIAGEICQYWWQKPFLNRHDKWHCWLTCSNKAFAI